MRKMLKTLIAAFALGLIVLSAPDARAEQTVNLLDPDLLAEAFLVQEAASAQVSNSDYMIIIDYRLHSNIPRFFLIDRKSNAVEAFLVAHGKGSDPDHDGLADRFSNVSGSKMSSLGALITGETYYGRHGLSLKLHGLDARNDKAEARAIVIHGADYVAPERRVLGRSWGCPALEQDISARIIPLIKGGAFVYAVGP